MSGQSSPDCVTLLLYFHVGVSIHPAAEKAYFPATCPTAADDLSASSGVDENAEPGSGAAGDEPVHDAGRKVPQHQSCAALALVRLNPHK